MYSEYSMHQLTLVLIVSSCLPYLFKKHAILSLINRYRSYYAVAHISIVIVKKVSRKTTVMSGVITANSN